MTHFYHQIDKTDLRRANWHETALHSLADGHVRLQIDSFALTANNVTYAAFGGPPMHYWNFFPAEDTAYGQVPVWGFATVAESHVDGVRPGHRVYGYFPISNILDVEAVRVSDRGFMDGAAHRQGLAPIYNTYSFIETDPAYRSAYEPQQMLFRPLYLTGWMICDSLVEGSPLPDKVIISSASSKTALATAHALKARGISTIGLTSPGNIDFVRTSGLYEVVLAYDAIDDITPGEACAYVDFVGRPALTAAIHSHCTDSLVRSLVIGVTDWEADRTPPAELAGPTPEFFFVPDYATARAKALPPGELDRRMVGDLVAFYPASQAFVTPEQVNGRDGVAAAWLKTVEGKVAPSRGLICSLQV